MAFTNCISSPTRSVLGCAGARCSSAPVRGGLPGPNRPVAHSQSHPNPPIEFIASKIAPNKARTMLQMVWYRRLVCTKYDSPDFLADPSVSMSSDHIYPPNVFRSVVTELSIQLLPTPPTSFSSVIVPRYCPSPTVGSSCPGPSATPCYRPSSPPILRSPPTGPGGTPGLTSWTPFFLQYTGEIRLFF